MIWGIVAVEMDVVRWSRNYHDALSHPICRRSALLQHQPSKGLNRIRVHLFSLFGHLQWMSRVSPVALADGADERQRQIRGVTTIARTREDLAVDRLDRLFRYSATSSDSQANFGGGFELDWAAGRSRGGGREPLPGCRLASNSWPDRNWDPPSELGQMAKRHNGRGGDKDASPSVGPLCLRYSHPHWDCPCRVRIRAPRKARRSGKSR